jgi:MoaA/NifB/PqqE/SkfB family radical SAM enzyme
LLKNKAQALYKAGLDFVNISLDSPYGNVHDKSKDFPGAFDAAIDGIKAARASKLRAIIAMVVDHQNLNNGEVEEMIILAKRLKVDLQLLPVIALGHFKGQFNMRLDNKDMKKFYDLTSRRNVRWDGRTNYLRKGCPAGLEKFTIDIFGDVYPCSLIPIKVGNIFEQRLEDIFHKTIKSEAFKVWSPVCRAAFNDEFIKKYMPI